MNILNYIISFLVGGFICFLAQILVIKTKMTAPIIMPIRYPLSPIFLAVYRLAIKLPTARLIVANGAEYARSILKISNSAAKASIDISVATTPKTTTAETTTEAEGTGLILEEAPENDDLEWGDFEVVE